MKKTKHSFEDWIKEYNSMENLTVLEDETAFTKMANKLFSVDPNIIDRVKELIDRFRGNKTSFESQLHLISAFILKNDPKLIEPSTDINKKLGLIILDIILPLALKVARADGEHKQIESNRISNYFHKTWGYNNQLIKFGNAFWGEVLDNYKTEELVFTSAKFVKENNNIDYDLFTKELVGFLYKLSSADGSISEHEKFMIEAIDNRFSKFSK